MTLLLITLVTSIAAALMAGGRLSGLRDVRLRGEAVLIVLFVIQGAIRGRLPMTSELRAWSLAAWVAVTLLVLAICVWNIRQPGMVLVVVGLSLNLIVVLANGGMPVSGLPSDAGPDAARTVSSGFYFSASGSEPLYYLGDVLPVPATGDRPTLVSVGDGLLFVGVWVFLFLTTLRAGRFNATGL